MLAAAPLDDLPALGAHAETQNACEQAGPPGRLAAVARVGLGSAVSPLTIRLVARLWSRDRLRHRPDLHLSYRVMENPVNGEVVAALCAFVRGGAGTTAFRADDSIPRGGLNGADPVRFGFQWKT